MSAKFDENTTLEHVASWLHKWLAKTTEQDNCPDSILHDLISEADRILEGQINLPFEALTYERPEIFARPSQTEEPQAEVQASLEDRIRWLETHHGGGLPADKPEGTPSEEPYGPYCWHA